MSIALTTICLNELEWLPRLHEQHKDWPGLRRWVFVEFADRAYAQANPEMVSNDGLSVDGTTEFLERLAKEDDRVMHVKLGFCGNAKQPAQGKCVPKTQCLRELDGRRIEFVVICDCDEFYTHAHQEQVVKMMSESRGNAFIFKRREIWRPPSAVHQPLFSQEVVGGFWDIPCCHWWRWFPGMEFKSNHNTPEVRGLTLGKHFVRFDQQSNIPQMLHCGFSASAKTRLAKNRYYEIRGETHDPKRSWYTESRKAWETWQPGDVLPHGAMVKTYDGIIPECFQEEQ